MKHLILAAALAASVPAQAGPLDIVKQDFACLASTTGDVFRGDFSTTAWPVWFQKLAGVKSLQAGQVSPCMPRAG